MLEALVQHWPVLLGLLVAVLLSGLAFLLLTAPKRTPRSENEWFYENPAKPGSKERFPDLETTPATIELSLVVPSYNEENRLPKMMDETMRYLKKRAAADPSFTYELVIVDDGSKDKTYQVALEESRKHGVDTVRVLRFDGNRGKGGAVRLGVQSTRGRRILMVDADGATEITDLGRLEQALDKVKVTSADEAQGVAVGSRAHLQNEAVAKRSLLRTVLMHGFHTLVVVLGGVKDVRDTQCGFKLFTRAAARRLFHNVHLERWCFDVEVLYIAQCLGIPVAEVAVNWTEIDGSHLDPLWSAVEMFKDLLLIRTFYLTGTWRLEDPDAKKRR